MTAADACALVVQTTQELSAARREADSWRVLAYVAMRHAADLQRNLDILDERSYIGRTRTADRLDIFLDHQDLREAEAA